MPDRKCPFSAPLIAEDFGCAHADQVVRRGGAEISCLSEVAHPVCLSLFESLKQASLDEFGVEDDLLSMTHAMLVKIQYGGLLCLQAGDADSVSDISSLVDACVESAGTVEQVPVADCAEKISGFRLRRRRR